MKKSPAIRILAQVALETASTEKQVLVYDAMASCMPTQKERNGAADIAASIRRSENLKTAFQKSQMEVFEEGGNGGFDSRGVSDGNGGRQ